MNPFDAVIPPLDEATLATIKQRSSDGEGVANIIRSLNLDIPKTLEQLRRFHVDEIESAKKGQRVAMNAKLWAIQTDAKPV